MWFVVYTLPSPGLLPESFKLVANFLAAKGLNLNNECFRSSMEYEYEIPQKKIQLTQEAGGRMFIGDQIMVQLMV